MKSRDYTILYIVGWCRSGSTLIGNLLNEVDGFFHGGEIHYFWRNTLGLGSNSICGCSSEITQCNLWSAVIKRLSEKQNWDELAHEVIRHQANCRTRHTWKILRSATKRQLIENYKVAYIDLYDTIADLTQASLIIDGGKFASEAALLKKSGEVNLKILHLIRDPRSVAISWSKPKDYIHKMSAWTSTFNWLGFNSAAQALKKAYPNDVYVLKYEDFITDPENKLREILSFLGCDKSGNCPVKGRESILNGNHTVTGNPDRLQSGHVTIRNTFPFPAPDQKLSMLISTLISTPQRIQYGYDWRTHH